jgi:hypothetical protein
MQRMAYLCKPLFISLGACSKNIGTFNFLLLLPLFIER